MIRKKVRNSIDYIERANQEYRKKQSIERYKRHKRVKKILSFLNNNARYFVSRKRRKRFLGAFGFYINKLNYLLRIRRGKKYIMFRRKIVKIKKKLIKFRKKFIIRFIRFGNTKGIKNQVLLQKDREYIFNNRDIGQLDSVFSVYKENINKLNFDLNRIIGFIVKKRLRQRLKWKRFKRFSGLYVRLFRKKIKQVIKNEILFISPEFFYIHKKAKSWRFLKLRRRRRLKFVKRVKIGYKYNKRQLYDLRFQLNKVYYWLLKASKLQTSTMMRSYNRVLKKDNVKNYFRIKKFFFKKKSRLLKLKRRDLFKFLKRKRFYMFFILNKFFKLFKKYVLFFSLLMNNGNFDLFKFYFLRFIYSFLFFFKKTRINQRLKNMLHKYSSSLLLLNKAKLKLRRRVRKKIRFYYDLVYTNKYKVYKLKVKMVSSNFFITLTDPNDNVIISRSTGHVAENRKKKVKLSPYLVTNMMYLVLGKLRKLKIKYLNIFVNTKINRHINNVVKSLKSARYTRILKIFFSKPIPHHFGTRKPKLRRL